MHRSMNSTALFQNVIARREQPKREAARDHGRPPADLCPGSAGTTIQWAMERIMVGRGLDLLVREYLLIASCVTLRDAVPQLRAHVASALKLGATKMQIVAVIRHMIAYAGAEAVAEALD